MTDEDVVVPDPGQPEERVVTTETTVVETETTGTPVEGDEPVVEEPAIRPGADILPPDLVTERHETWAERLSRLHHEHSWLTPVVLAIFLIIVVGIVFGFSYFAGLFSHEEAEEPTRTVPKITTPVATPTAPEPPPFSTEGAKSWTEWMAKANAQKDDGKLGMWKALADLHFGGDLDKAYAAVKYQVVKEGEHGLNYYVRTVPPEGMPILNTSPKGKSYVPIPNRSLKPGDTYLVLDKDNPFAGGQKATSPKASGKETPAIRRACGNPIKIVKPKPPKKCTNNTGQYKKHAKQDPSTNVGPTPGYTPGNAEEVVKEQESQPKGGTNPTPSGTPGTGSGGITPGGPGIGDPVPNPGAGVTIGGTVPDD